MGVRRDAVGRKVAALLPALLIAVWPALAAAEGLDLLVPDVPGPLTSVDTGSAPDVAPTRPSVSLTLPDPPEVAVEVAAAPEPDAASPAVASLDGIPLPEPAPVTLTAAEVATAAVEMRLLDPKLPLPPRLPKKDREALAAVYAARGHQPLWTADGSWTEGGRGIAERLARAAEDGLDPAAYPVPDLRAGQRPLSPADLAEADIKLSAAAYLYARDARGGRLEPSRLSGLITPKLILPTVEAVLDRLAGAARPGDALAGYNPAYPGYAALRERLAELRAGRVASPLVQDPGLRGRVREAAVGGARLARAPNPRLEGDLVANMERWRWLPADVPSRAIVVNIPEFRLRLIEDGRTVHEARVATGKAQTPTPVFTGLIQYAVVNPSWYIPPSIVRQHPGLGTDPTYASRAGLSVVRSGRTVSYRQPPGPTNALGYIKFMFPNDHAVYLHDTPNRSIFGGSHRALSHGCVRLENPFALGGKILGAGWTEGRLKSLIGHGERSINLSEKLPISLAYFTVTVDETGEMHMFDDVYGFNRRVRTALGLGA